MNSLYLAIGHELGAEWGIRWWDRRGDGGWWASAVQSGDVVAWRRHLQGETPWDSVLPGPGWPWEAVLYWESGFLG